MPYFLVANGSLARFQYWEFASGEVAMPTSPIAPARASGEMRRKGTAVVIVFTLPSIVCADAPIDARPVNKLMPISAKRFAIRIFFCLKVCKGSFLKAAKAGWLQSRSVSRSQDNELSSRLNNYLYYDRTLAFDADFEKKVEALTAAQVNGAMKKFIDPKKISIVKAGDFDKKVSGDANSASGVSGSGKN